MLPYNKSLKLASRELRKTMTDAEMILWSQIRDRKILGVQFYRQKPVVDFIVDFYSPGAQLVIEVDGEYHQVGNQKEVDKERDALLAELGLKVLRFKNWQVLKETNAVLNEIGRVIKKRLKNPPAKVTFY